MIAFFNWDENREIVRSLKCLDVFGIQFYIEDLGYC